MKKIYNTILALLPPILAYITSLGQIYGSKIDWLSQHIVIADILRHTQNYVSSLQAGTNIYSFSYYGLFRPDVLISRLFLSIDIKCFIIGYAILLWSLTGLLCFKWLLHKGYKMETCFVASIICVCSNCFFHTHQQIMFVEILPFLFLAMILVDANKKQWICLCVCMAMFHNYFYTPGFILILCLYNYHKDHTIKDIIIPILIGIGLSCVLWLPTGLVILDNKKCVAPTSLISLFIPDFSLKGILYNSYGCGLIVIAWLALFQGLAKKKTRNMSILLILMFIFPLFSYILNGTLYARSKILVLCLPMVVYVFSEWIESRNINILCLLASCLFIKEFYLFDIVLALIFIYYYFFQKKNILLFYAIIPCLIFMSLNMNQGLLYKIYDSVYSKDKETLIQRNTLNKRTADLNHVYLNSNQTYSKLNKASSYTSTSNSLYNTWFYDIVKNPISQTQRTVLCDSENYVYLSMMSIENVISTKDDLYGYEVMDTQGKYKLLMNKNVFPLAYVTNEVMSESDFDELKYPNTLDTMYNRTIVSGKTKKSYTSKMKLYYKDNHIYRIHSKKKTKKKIDVDFKNQMVCIDFDVKNKGKKKVVIKMNGMQNTLSKKNAIYANSNHHFTYVLSKKNMDALNICLSRGNYQISNIKVYTCPMSVFSRKVQKVKMKKGIGYVKALSSGYFVTSIPYEKGYSLYIDGKKTDIEVVNKAFIGAKIKKGKHTVVLKYETPGEKLAIVVSATFVLIGGYYIWKKSKNS